MGAAPAMAPHGLAAVLDLQESAAGRPGDGGSPSRSRRSFAGWRMRFGGSSTSGLSGRVDEVRELEHGDVADRFDH